MVLLAYMLDTVFIYSIIAIAKLLGIAKAILNARNALSTIITLVFGIAASNIGATTMKTRPAHGTITSISIWRYSLNYHTYKVRGA